MVITLCNKQLSSKNKQERKKSWAHISLYAPYRQTTRLVTEKTEKREVYITSNTDKTFNLGQLSEYSDYNMGWITGVQFLAGTRDFSLLHSIYTDSALI
jgi:hypothetical protein